MTYHPLAETHDTGTAYFESLGLIGGSTGMVPLISSTTTFPSYTGEYGTPTPAITDSVLKYGSGAGSSYVGYDFSEAMDQCLGIVYCSGHGESKIGFQAAAIDTSGDMTAGYIGGFNDGITRLFEKTGSWDQIGDDQTIGQDESVNAPIWGMAIYVNGATGVIKVFIKSGSAQWIQVLTATDDPVTNSTFLSCLVRTSPSADTRLVTPFYVWGAT